MKLRMEKGNIKIRLAPPEIDQLQIEKRLDEKIYISESNHFRYSIQIDEKTESCKAAFEQNALMIHIPIEKAEKWINSKQIGIKETIVTDNEEILVLTLEEDLPPRKHKKKQ